MPTPPIPPRPTPPRPTPVPTPGKIGVRPGDTLSKIAARELGDANRWREIYDANRGVIGNDPGKLKVGQKLAIPGRGPAQPTPPAPPSQPTPPRQDPKPPTTGATPKPVGPRPPAPQPPTTQPKPPVAPPPAPTNGSGDRDRDGVMDRYDRSPDNPNDRRWNKAATDEYVAYAKEHTLKLAFMGVEIDCADLAVKLVSDFCKKVGLPNPLGAAADKFQVYEPGRTGGLPNVQGPNYFLPGYGADQLAKSFTKDVNDADGNGIKGWDRKTGQIDVADLRAGDILFFDWEGDGKVNHTVNVLEVHPDGSVLLGWGTYDNLAQDGNVKWKNLDLSQIQGVLLTPGTEDYEKWLGAGNSLWGARRYSFQEDKGRSASIAHVPYVKPVEALISEQTPAAPAKPPTPIVGARITPAEAPNPAPAAVQGTVDPVQPPAPAPAQVQGTVDPVQPLPSRPTVQGFVDPVQPKP